MQPKKIKQTISMGIGLTVGFVLYDYLFKESIDWPNAIVVGIITAVIFPTIYKFVKKKGKVENNNQ